MCLFYEFQTFNIKADVHGGSIKEDIVVDLQKKLLTVNVGSVAHLNSDCPSTINLHDFKKVLYYLHKIGVTCIITCWFAVELYCFFLFVYEWFDYTPPLPLKYYYFSMSSTSKHREFYLNLSQSEHWIQVMLYQ